MTTRKLQLTLYPASIREFTDHVSILNHSEIQFAVTREDQQVPAESGVELTLSITSTGSYRELGQLLNHLHSLEIPYQLVSPRVDHKEINIAVESDEKSVTESDQITSTIVILNVNELLLADVARDYLVTVDLLERRPHEVRVRLDGQRVQLVKMVRKLYHIGFNAALKLVDTDQERP
jgi:hypothetical protein